MSESHVVIQCPHCGAPLPPDAETRSVVCTFCKVAIAPAPRSEAVAAPAASSKRKPPVKPTSRVTDLKCPRCELGLFEGRTSNVVMNGCGACGGLWLDNDGSRLVVAKVDNDVAELASRAEANATNEVDTVAGGLPCPVCQAVLKRVHVSKADLDLDICGAHGTWFDRGELQKVMNACGAQGLPKLPAWAPMAVAVPDGKGGYVAEANAWRSGSGMDGAAAAIAVGGVFAVVGALLGSGSDS
ncbi:MAG: zf-TFIIB domain-containing protein [Deltaproteobacteria bacterium]|nr:zf-TFIIB domain-containing protein [Deltaproteobacteria bacterium]